MRGMTAFDSHCTAAGILTLRSKEDCGRVVQSQSMSNESVAALLLLRKGPKQV